MKIVYSGGWNHKSKENVCQSVLIRYYEVFKKAFYNEKRIALVTLGKEDGFFDDVILPDYSNIADIIDRNNKNIFWDSYDMIIILGGITKELYDYFVILQFSLKKLKNNCIVIGDSAGSHVLSSYFFQSPPGPLRGI